LNNTISPDHNIEATKAIPPGSDASVSAKVDVRMSSSRSSLIIKILLLTELKAIIVNNFYIHSKSKCYIL